jgi:hypothetical protein
MRALDQWVQKNQAGSRGVEIIRRSVIQMSYQVRTGIAGSATGVERTIARASRWTQSPPSAKMVTIQRPKRHFEVGGGK